MVTEKNNFSSNAQHNFGKGKVTSKCRNDKPWKNYIGKVSAPPFKKTCTCTILQPSCFNFSDSPPPPLLPALSAGRNQNLLPPTLKRGESELCLLQYYQSFMSFMRNQEGKIHLKKKVNRWIYVRDITFRLHTLFPMLFVVVFCLLHLFLLLQYITRKYISARKWWGSRSPCLTLLHKSCNLASYLYNRSSNNQCVCVPTIISHATDPSQAHSYWGGNIFRNKVPSKAFEATSFRK